MRRDKQRHSTVAGYAPILVVTSVALALRLLHVLFTSTSNPLATDLILDAANYDRWALALVFGGETIPHRLIAAPLYPWFLSLIYSLWSANLTAVRISQALLGTASCALIVVITKRLFQSKAAAIVAGMGAALYLPTIFYEGVIVPATLILFLNLLFIFILVPGNGAPGTGRIIAGAVVLGLSVTVKPVALLLFPFAVLHLYFKTLRPGREAEPRPKRPRAVFSKRVLLLTAGLVVSLIPLTVRNARLSGEFIPFSTGGGIAFYTGNNPRANGFYAIPSFKGKPMGGTPEEQWENMHAMASHEAGRTLSPSEVSAFWLKKGIEHNLRNRRQCARLVWLKFLYFWNGYERANVENFYFHRRFKGILTLPLLTFGIVAPLGLLGVFLTRERWRDLWLLYGGILTYLLTALIFYVLARYRLPVVPFIMPFAGIAIVEIARLCRNRSIGELIITIAALAVLFTFSNMKLASDTPTGISNNFSRLGKAYLARGDSTLAAQAFQESLTLDPENQDARMGMKILGIP